MSQDLRKAAQALLDHYDTADAGPAFWHIAGRDLAADLRTALAYEKPSLTDYTFAMLGDNQRMIFGVTSDGLLHWHGEAAPDDDHAQMLIDLVEQKLIQSFPGYLGYKADVDHEAQKDRLGHSLVGKRVRMTGTDEEGRHGEVEEYDEDRGILFVDLDTSARPFRSGFTIGCGVYEVELEDKT